MAIRVLEQDTINKIAAGEVIERPMAVVKELVENAIDAGASSITVEIKDGGKSLIRITDNGSGIESDDIKLAFTPHATSKIHDADDLLAISTLGFRGEALASIASVSQLEMLTKTRSSFSGNRYLIDGGVEKGLEETGCPDGTTFIVRNLFYNTPARLKFLKTPQTEAGYIGGVLERMALSHPNISFRFINQNQPKLHASGNGNLKDVIYNIYGRDIASSLLEIRGEDENCSISGYLGKPEITRGNRSFINYFINGRYIKSNIIHKAIEDAYAPYTMQHRYPFTVLHFEIEPEYIDVNVHPQKMEIRFTNERQLYESIYKAISAVLSSRELIPNVSMEVEHKKEHKLPKQMEHENEPEKQKSYSEKTAVDIVKDFSHVKKEEKNESKVFSNGYQKERTPHIGEVTLKKPTKEERQHLLDGIFRKKEIADDGLKAGNFNQTIQKENDAIKKFDSTQLVKEKASYETKQQSMFEDEGILSKEAKKDIKIIGQVFSTYWILQYNEEMYMIDQHAAHEKVLYERFMKQIKSHKVMVQMLNPPILLTLSLAGQQAVEAHMEVLEQLGFRIESFGGNEYIVNGVPAHLPDLAGSDLLTEVIDGLAEENGKKAPEMLLDRVATMACKAAVKGGHDLAVEQAHELLKELMTLDNPYHCPHGRPTMVKMTKKDIEKMFKRIV